MNSSGTSTSIDPQSRTDIPVPTNTPSNEANNSSIAFGTMRNSFAMWGAILITAVIVVSLVVQSWIVVVAIANLPTTLDSSGGQSSGAQGSSMKKQTYETAILIRAKAGALFCATGIVAGMALVVFCGMFLCILASGAIEGGSRDGNRISWGSLSVPLIFAVLGVLLISIAIYAMINVHDNLGTSPLLPKIIE